MFMSGSQCKKRPLLFKLFIIQLIMGFGDGIFWSCSAAFSKAGSAVIWWASAEGFILMLRFFSILFNNTRRVAKLDEEHFRERQGLLVIIVLGEAVAASAVTASNDTVRPYFVSMSMITIAFLLKVLYFDCPKSEIVGKSALSDPDADRWDETGVIWLVFQRIPQALHAPAHMVLPGVTTLVASTFRSLF